MIIDPVINGFILNEVKIIFHIRVHSIITICIRGICLGFSNTSHAKNFYTFIKIVVDEEKFDISFLKREAF